MHFRSLLASTVVAVSVWTSGALAQHAGDIIPIVENNQVVMAAAEPGENRPELVFGADFGDSGFPGFTSNPGYNAVPNTFTAGTQFRVDMDDQLLVWDGAGFVPTAGETLTMTYFSSEMESADVPVAGFPLTVPGDGGLHIHYNLFLNGVAPDDPTPGVYLMRWVFWSSEVDASEPYYIVFNHEVSSMVHDEAIQWVIDNLLPSTCAADISSPADDEVNFDDLSLLLGFWGACPSPNDACDAANIARDGSSATAIDFDDLSVLLGLWGACS